MIAISLKDFYKKIEKGNFGERVVFKNPYTEVGVFEILETIGLSSSGYVFLAEVDDKKRIALRMSYKEDDYQDKLRTVMILMGDDYKKYLLEFQKPLTLLKYAFIGDEQIFFDRDVFVSAWEPADNTLKYNLDESFDNKLKWFIQFLKDLKAMHSKDLIHFDLKLENLFLVNNRLKIGNFEFYLKKDDFLKNDLRLCGTPGHMAPEIFYDRDNISAKCDIFSAGIAFCELFSGSKPPDDLLKKTNDLSNEEQEDFQRLFGDRRLVIRDEDISAFFLKNYRVFNFFKHEVRKKIDTGRIPGKERKIHELLLTMIEIDSESRPDVDRLIFKAHEIEFDPESLINKRLLGRYIVQELIDEGGRGIIYKVWDPIEETARAIKLFPPQFNYIKDGFEQIRNELRYIPHRNIVDFYGLQREEEGDLNFILMEYIKGFNLKKKLGAVKGKKLREVEALAIMKQVASGLIEAHRNGVIHRNLKDTNIMITAEGNRVKIINFGLSLKIKKAISDTTGQDLMGSSSLLVAPPEHLAEIWKEDNAQTDVWGYGILLYQLLMGRMPFDEKDLIRDPATIPAITGISERTNAVIMKCLEKDRQKRYRNMEEVCESLFEGKPTADYQELENRESGKKISKFFQQFKKKWVMGLTFLTFVFIAAIWLILGPGIIGGGKKYEMWYSGKPGNADTPGGGIGYAISSDGIQWERDKNNPIIPHGEIGSFNQFESGQPYVVHDGQYFHMLFSGSTRTDKSLEYHIGYSRFENIAKWTKNNIEEVILDNGKIKFPGPILYMGDYYKMWFSENDAIYYARTTVEGQSILKMERYSDRHVLTKGNPGDWDQDCVIIGSVLFESGKFRMWYTGKSGGESRIGYATSGDGITWNKYPVNPVYDDQDVTLEMNPCVIHDSSGYKMYYTASTEKIEYYPVRLATSTDGIQWKKYSNNPVLDTGSEDWEKAKIFVTAIIYNDK
ncbi:MAG: protein kinase [Candidatus Aminicenantes bacterium]|nr:protein kinase [Candidatus Aminicenantes bacterium]